MGNAFWGKRIRMKQVDGHQVSKHAKKKKEKHHCFLSPTENYKQFVAYLYTVELFIEGLSPNVRYQISF